MNKLNTLEMIIRGTSELSDKAFACDDHEVSKITAMLNYVTVYALKEYKNECRRITKAQKKAS